MDAALREALQEPWLERFIGVISRPGTERRSHYSSCSLSEPFNGWVWFDEPRRSFRPPLHHGRRARNLPVWPPGDISMSYRRFLVMIVVSTVLMFGLMYLNTFAVDHVEYSQTRMWMAVLMGAAMAIVMMGFMWSMYRNTRLNTVIMAGAVVVFVGCLWLVRSQATVGDVSYMRAMIPHHSIALLTSERAHIRDPEVRRLADRIIEAQRREIAEMKRHIARLEAKPSPAGANDLPSEDGV